MQKIIIIGGGISGLCAGIYAQQNGFESIILEKNHLVGGMCFGWERHGCYIDGCIHSLTGTKAGTKLNEVWKNTGALDGAKIVDQAYLYQYLDGQTTITIHKDLNKFKQSLLAVAPEDKDQIERLIGHINVLKNIDVPIEKPNDLMSFKDMLGFIKSMGKVLRPMMKLSKITVADYASRFKNKTLQSFIHSYMPGHYSIMQFIIIIATFVAGNGGVIDISSKQFSQNILKKYLSLGGVVECNSPVTKIEIKNKALVSVKCQNNKTYTADYYISAIDPYILFNDLLDKSYFDQEFAKRYDDVTTYPVMANCYSSYAVEESLAVKLPSMLTMTCAPFQAANKQITKISLKNYTYFKNKNGLTTLISPLMQDEKDFDYWKTLSVKDYKAYQAEKISIGNHIQQTLINQYPFLNQHIKLIDIATPVTYERYHGAYKGAYMAFMMTPKSKRLNHCGKIKNLNNFYLANQWMIFPGGLASAAAAGKFAIQRICHKNKHQFIG